MKEAIVLKMKEATNTYLNLSNQTIFRSNEINKIKYYVKNVKFIKRKIMRI